jgi:diguanylate cyclase (GGDEF)-like protein
MTRAVCSIGSSSMPRPPLQRTLFAMLPILGALLAAIAGHERWPLPLSLLAMSVIASASAVIYWSAPLSKRKDNEAPPAALPDAMLSESIPQIVAAVEPEAPIAEALPDAQLIGSKPEPDSVGTRADAIATGEWRETDLLTGLLNPDVFFARVSSALERCSAANQTAILVICDLDGFGAINQKAGLVDANHLLRQVAECFRLTVREGDVLSRLGGDEFGIFFPGLPPEVAETRARDLRAAVREAGLLVLQEGSEQVTACLGISSFPADGDTADALLAAANASLAAARQERQENAAKPVPSVLVVARTHP